MAVLPIGYKVYCNTCQIKHFGDIAEDWYAAAQLTNLIATHVGYCKYCSHATDECDIVKLIFVRLERILSKL